MANRENTTYIKLFRKMLTWEWYGDTNTTRVFLHILLNAQYQPSRLNGHEIGHDDFERDDQNDGCYLTHEGLRRYLSKFDSKLETHMQYVKSADKMTFRTAIGYQINQLEKAIQEIYKEERH